MIKSHAKVHSLIVACQGCLSMQAASKQAVNVASCKSDIVFPGTMQHLLCQQMHCLGTPVIVILINTLNLEQDHHCGRNCFH